MSCISDNVLVVIALMSERTSFDTPLLPCPFCGFKPRATDDDCVYPDNRERTRWAIHCYDTGGGCGAMLTGYSPQDVIEKWNKRT